MYYHHQNYSYNQNDAYRRRHRRRRRGQNPSYYDQNYAYRHRNPSYYDQKYPYRHIRRHHQNQHHHQNPSFDQIPHRRRHQQQQYDQNRLYDRNLSYNHHQIEAPTRLLLLVAKVKAKAPVVVDFPVDVLIPILARLPAKTLLKFRCVCKSWNSLIQQDHHFISLHLNNNNNNNNKKLSPLVTFRREGFVGILNYSSSSSDSTHYEIDFSQSIDEPRYITNSCNGLLGLYNSCSLVIVNPTIRKLRPLPRPTRSFYSSGEAGLGFDSSTGVYKVVRIFAPRREEGTNLARFGCEVNYLGGSGGWKQIDGPPVQPSFLSLPVVVDGAILWGSKTVLEVVALSFDLREEKFSVIMHPEGSSSRSGTLFFTSHVFASGGCICVAEEKTSMHTNIMNIWLLIKDDKKNNPNKWVKQCVIDLTFVLAQTGPLGSTQPLTTDHNGRIVISWGDGRKDYYDPRTGSFEKHELDATHADVEYAAPYTESMVWLWPTHCGVQ